MSNERICPDCHGKGLLWSPVLMEEDMCRKCGGYGVIFPPLQTFGAPSGVTDNEKLTREELNYENP